MARTKQWLQDRLKLSNKDILSIYSSPQVYIMMLSVSVLEKRIEWLQDKFTLNDEDIGKLVRQQPRILSLKNLAQTLDSLQNILQCDDATLLRAIRHQPQILTYNIYTNVIPTFRFYAKCIGIKRARALLAARPKLFSCSLERRLKPRLEVAKKLGLEVNPALLRQLAQCTEDQWLTYQGKMSGLLV